MDRRHRIGRHSEQRAASFIQRRQGRVLAQGFWLKCGEIDWIFEEPLPKGGTVLVFLEVRFRDSRSGWRTGLESVDGKKQARLKRAAAVFLSRYRGSAEEVRFDVLSLDERLATYYPGAFE